jgi:hypothetical protein
MENQENQRTPEREFIGVREALAFTRGIMGRSTLLYLCYEGRIKSHVVRAKGNVRGKRAISVESLKQFLARGCE